MELLEWLEWVFGKVDSGCEVFFVRGFFVMGGVEVSVEMWVFVGGMEDVFLLDFYWV